MDTWQKHSSLSPDSLGPEPLSKRKKKKIYRNAWWCFSQSLKFATFDSFTLEINFSVSFSQNPGFPCGSAGKESARNSGDLALIPGLGRSPGEGKGYPLQYSDLKNSMDYTVHGVAKNRTQLRDFHFHKSYRVSSSLQMYKISMWII